MNPATGYRYATLNFRELENSRGRTTIFMNPVDEILFQIEDNYFIIEIKSTGWGFFDYYCSANGNLLKEDFEDDEDNICYSATIDSAVTTKAKIGNEENKITWYCLNLEGIKEKIHTTIHRRYREFVKLDVAIRQNFRTSLVPSLPTKGDVLDYLIHLGAGTTPLSNFDAFVEARRSGLAHYMLQLLRIPCIDSFPQFRAFVGLGDSFRELSVEIDMPDISKCFAVAPNSGVDPITVSFSTYVLHVWDDNVRKTLKSESVLRRINGVDLEDIKFEDVIHILAQTPRPLVIHFLFTATAQAYSAPQSPRPVLTATTPQLSFSPPPNTSPVLSSNTVNSDLKNNLKESEAVEVAAETERVVALRSSSSFRMSKDSSIRLKNDQQMLPGTNIASTRESAVTRLSLIPVDAPGSTEGAEVTLRRVLEYSHMSAGWKTWYERDEVMCSRKTDDDAPCVREDGLIPAAAADVFRQLVDPSSAKVINPELTQIEILNVFSTQTWAVLLTFEKHWPALQRYIVVLRHWTILADGRVVVYSRSEQLDELHPPLDPKTTHRGDLQFEGYIIEPRGERSCAVTYLSKADHSPLPPLRSPHLANLRRLFSRQERFSMDISGHKSDGIPTYQDLIDIAETVIVVSEIEGVAGLGTSSDPPRLTEAEISRSEPPLTSGDLGIPEKYLARTRSTLEVMMENMYGLADGWKFWFRRSGVTCYRKHDPSVRDQEGLCVREVTLLPVSALDVFEYFIDVKNIKDINPEIQDASTLLVCSPFSWVRQVTFYKKWPMAQRYFIDMTHWVRLPDGRVVIFTRSERMEELKPYSPKEDKKKGMIRGEIHFAGFVLESRGPTGCLVTHILKLEMNGKIPTPIVNTAKRFMPLGLENAKKTLARLSLKIAPPSFQPGQNSYLFEDYVSTARRVFSKEQSSTVPTHAAALLLANNTRSESKSAVRNSVLKALSRTTATVSKVISRASLSRDKTTVQPQSAAATKVISSESDTKKMASITSEPISMIPLTTNSSFLSTSSSSSNLAVNTELSEDSSKVLVAPVEAKPKSESQVEVDTSSDSAVREISDQIEHVQEEEEEEEEEECDVEPEPDVEVPTEPAKTIPSIASSVPPEYVQSVEQCFDTYIPYADISSGWQPWFESDGVVAHSKMEGDMMCVRGETVIRASLTDLFRFALDIQKCKVFNPMIVHASIIKAFTTHAWSRLLKFEKLWPITQRYFVELIHWCILPDGRAVIHSHSERLDSLHPPENDNEMVRGHIHFNFLVCEPRGRAGCHVINYVKVGLGGSIPVNLVNKALARMPMGLVNARKALVGKPLDDNSFTLEELESIADAMLFGSK